MAKEYQSEKSPIFDSQKSQKTQRKLHIMSSYMLLKFTSCFATPGIVISYDIIFSDTQVPSEWGESDPCYIINSEVCCDVQKTHGDYLRFVFRR